MLYSNKDKTQKGKVWQLPNMYWRACNHKGQQCTFKLWNEAKTFAAKGLNEVNIGQIVRRAQELRKTISSNSKIDKILRSEFPDADSSVILYVVLHAHENPKAFGVEKEENINELEMGGAKGLKVGQKVRHQGKSGVIKKIQFGRVGGVPGTWARIEHPGGQVHWINLDKDRKSIQSEAAKNPSSVWKDPKNGWSAVDPQGREMINFPNERAAREWAHGGVKYAADPGSGYFKQSKSDIGIGHYTGD